MTQLTVLGEIKSGDLVDPSRLENMMREMFDRGVQTLSTEGSLADWETEEYMKVMEVKKEIEKLIGLPHVKVPEKFRKEKDKIEGRIRDAFLRAGLCKHGNLSEVMDKLKTYDDVIIAPDTNVLMDCTITSILWDEIQREELPNWILVTVPKIVTAEIERRATTGKVEKKGHPRDGWPSYEGRIARRALQEILDLDQNVKRKGISIMTIGKLPENYDQIKNTSWRVDSEIRAQFRDFLRNIDFHKGAFFLTQDRVNAMMAKAEGVEGLYLQKPLFEEITNVQMDLGGFSRLLYELAVIFGEVRISGRGKINPSFDLSIFWPGKHVSHWEKFVIKITRPEGV